MQPGNTSADTHIIVDNPRCPICGRQARVYLKKDRTFFNGTCQTCGPVWITPDAAEFIRHENSAHLLSAWIRRHSMSPWGDLYAITEVRKVIEDSPSFTVLEKLDMTLRLIAERTAAPGQIATTDYTSDYPLVYAASPDEMLFYVKQLGGLGLVEVSGGQYATLTAAGYERLQELQTTSTFSNTAFVAMSFAPDLKPVYQQAIEPAVKKAGYRSLIMWDHEHVNRIDDEIIAQIRKARFMVADFTHQNQGAYFEAGFMQGLGRPVFWMCNENEVTKLHFDTRQYNHILYKELEDASIRLYNRIVAVIGEGRGAEVA